MQQLIHDPRLDDAATDAITSPVRPFTDSFNFNQALVGGGWLARLNGTELKVLLAYAKHARAGTGVAWPAAETVAGYLGLADGRSQVMRARRKLCEYGLLRKLPERSGVAPFRVLMPAGGAADSAAPSDWQRCDIDIEGAAESAAQALPVPHPEMGQEMGQGSETCADNVGGVSDFPLIKTKPDRVSQDRIDADVEAIWQAYPLKLGKPSALRAIREAIKERTGKTGSVLPTRWLLEAVNAYARRVAAAGLDVRYIRRPANYFNDQDYVAERQPAEQTAVRTDWNNSFREDN